MKTILLSLSIIICLLFLGVKNADANTSVNDIAIASGTIYQGQLDNALAGIYVTTTNNTATLTGATFTINQSLTGALANVQLVTSPTATFNPLNYTILGTPTGQTATTITFSGLTTPTVARNSTVYYYLIADYTGTTTGTYTFKPATYNTGGGNTNVPNPVTTNTFVLKAPLLTQAQVTAGLATNPLVTSQNNIGVYGMSLTSNGTSTFTTLNFTTTSTLPANSNISTYFPAVTLYSSASATFDGTATAVTGATYSTLGATNLTVTVPTQTINDGVTTYYYLVANYTEPASTATFQFGINSISGGTATTTTPTYGTKTGPTYTLTAPSIAEASITAGLAATTLTSSQTGIAIYGISLTSTGANSITALNFTATQPINTYFPSVTLYSSTSATFSGSATAVTGATYTYPTSSTLTVTLPSAQAMANGAVLYYYLVVNYTEPTTTTTFQFSLTSITGATATTGAAAGQTYTLTAPSIAEASITAGLAGTTLITSQNGIAIYGMSLSSTGTNSITALNFTATQPISTYFPSVTLYSSTSSTFSGTATPVTGATYTYPTSSTLTVTLPSAQVMANGAVLYYYLVVNYAEPSTATTFQFSLTSIAGAIATTGTAAGQTYTLTAPSIAEASITAGLAATTLTASQNAIAIYGMSLTATGPNSFTALNFTATQPISGYFPSVTLYSSTSNTFSGSATAVTGATYTYPTSSTLTVTLPSAQAMVNGAVLYYYLVVNYTEPATTTTFQVNLTSVTGANTTGAAAGQSYTLTAPALTEAQITTGLAANPLIASQNTIGVYGISLKATGNASFSALSFTTASTTPTGSNISTYFPSVTLYSSTSNTFSTGTATVVAGATYSSLSATTLTISGLSETINDGVTKYYYLVVNYTEPATTATFQFSINTITGSATTFGVKPGTIYTLTAPSLTEAPITAGLATNPLSVSQNTIGVFGMSLKASGNASFTALSFTTASTAPTGSNISTYFPSVTLYSSTSNTFSTGTATAVAGATYSSLNATTLTVSGLTETINDGITKYYYLVVNYTQPVTSATYQFAISTVTGNTTTFGTKTGTNYTINAPTLTENQTTGGLYTPTTISGNQTNLPLSGISLVAANGSAVVTTLNYTTSQNISTYFAGNVNLYVSSSSTFSMGTATKIATTPAPASKTISFSVPVAYQTVTSTPVYFYLVLDSNIPPATSTGFEIDITSVTTANAITYSDKTGTNYTLSAAVTLGTASTTGLDPNPLNVSQTGAILGFSVTTTTNETFTQFNFTASKTISTYFANVKLYSSTTNSFASATQVSGTPTISALNSTTLTISGLSQTINSSTVYYFIVADFTLPTTASTFQLSATGVAVGATTYTNGANIAGTVYNVGPASPDWKGGSGTGTTKTDWNTAANWSNGVVPGPYDNVNIGVNAAYITSSNTNNPIISSAETASVASITFGAIQSQFTTTYTYGTEQLMSLQVDGSLTVSGNITQNHSASQTGVKWNYLVTTIKGNGTVLCQGNFVVGDATTQPNPTVADVAQVSIQVNHLTVNGNVVLNTNGNGNNITNPGNNGTCYPYFSVEKGTTTLLKQITFAPHNSPLMRGFDLYNPGATAYEGYGLVTADITPSSPSTLELQYITPIAKADYYYVHFTYGGNNGTVLYDDPNNETQTIYVANEPSVTTTQTYINTATSPAYWNLSFSGPGTKSVDANSTIGTAVQGLNIGGIWTTAGGTVDLTQEPTVTVGGAWNNTTTIHHDTGPITVGGMFTNNTGGTLNCGTGTITFNGGYTNNATFTANATGLINFSPPTAETITDNSINGTIFNMVNFTSGTSTIMAGTSGIGNIAVSNVGKLKMSGAAQLVAGTTTVGGLGYLTLMSNATSTATVYTPGGTKISGNVNAQRWVTGGAGYRGYRLFSSPVNVSLSTAGNGNLGLSYLGANASFASTTYNGAFTEGPGTGFIFNGSYNPIIYLYDESRATNNSGFTSGKNIGIYSITGNTVTTLTSGVQAANISIPVGNSYLLYYVGNNTSTVVANTRIPESTAVTATGYLNQGNVPVVFWNTNSTTIPYDVNGGNLPGLNQVGNPYASTIQLSTVYSDNSANNISPQFWELDATTGISGTYIAYNASSGATSTTRSSNYVVSGQGFLVQALGTGATITFKEDQKMDYPAITSGATSGGALLMDIPTASAQTDITARSFAQNNTTAPASTPAPAALSGLHLQLSFGSTAYTQTGIYFSSKWTDTYNPMDDAMDLDGATPMVYLSSYSSDSKRLSINQLGDYSKGKRVRLYAGANSSGSFSISLADLANIDTSAYNVYLVDKKMNDSLDMVRYKSYAFTINNSDTTTYGAYRFVLAIERKAVPPYFLASFTGQKVSNGVQLTWRTINEGTYTGFTLQKLAGINNYTSIYNTQGTGAGIYTYVDQHPTNGSNTYRLQQTDINGNVTYSSPVTINYNSSSPNGSLTIYPNPSKTIINISLNTNDPGTQNYVADIYNTSGAVIDHKTVNSNTWTQDITSYKLGVYIIEIKSDTGYLVGQSKFVKIN